jgi:hypothetical protein
LIDFLLCNFFFLCIILHALFCLTYFIASLYFNSTLLDLTPLSALAFFQSS